MNRLRAIDLCCGAGGWACAARGLPIDLVHAYDIWPTAIETYRHNHPATHCLVKDLTDPCPLVAGTGPRIDLILGGIPCQWLSPVRRTGTVQVAERTRERNLLDAVLAIVHNVDPRWWCLEDVIQLRRELPPLTPYRVLNAHTLGYSIQNRKRLFVGHFPAPGENRSGPGHLTQFLQPGPYWLGDSGRTCDLAHIANRRHVSPSKLRCGVNPTDQRFPTVCNWSNRHKNLTPLILDARLPGGRRELEWQEAARLQGFPADYVFCGSMTAVWKQIGNAVQIDLARAILRAICRDAGL